MTMKNYENKNKRVRREKKLPSFIVDFFDDIYGIDVSYITLVEEHFADNDTTVGEYRYATPGFVYFNLNMDKQASALAYWTTCVHEINHALQCEKNIGISMSLQGFRTRFNLDADNPYDAMYNVSDWAIMREDELGYGTDETIDYAINPLEIDSRLAEIYFLNYYCKIPMNKLAPIVTDYGVSEELKERVLALPEGDVKTFLLQEINK